MKEITIDSLNKYEKDFDSERFNEIAMNAVVSNGIDKSAVNYSEVRRARHNYSITIETGDITNQKQSGRCWMFAALNLMRIEVMRNLNLKTMELSQSYPLFYDKLEKTNYFLDSIIKTVNEPLEERLVSHLLTDPLCDGGQWDMFVNLVKKYGVVPKDAMPESISSSATKELDRYLTLKLREFAHTIRSSYENGKSIDDLYDMKDDMLNTIYRMLSISLGKPPKEFTYEITDKNGKFIRIENITPVEFFNKYVDIELDDYISIINAPTKDKPYGKTFTVDYLGNVAEGREIKYLNLPIDDLKLLAIKQLKDDKAVWFGSDVGQFSTREGGILSTTLFDADHLYSTTFPLTKEERLNYHESLMTHAMLLTGVNLDDENIPNRWRVENSWGKDVGKDGFYVMTDEWFDEFVYQVVINKKYLSKEQLEMYEQDPIILKPWDPMGSLAKNNELH